MNINRPHLDIVSIAGRFLITFVLVLLIILQMARGYVSAADYVRPSNRSLQIGTTTPGITTDYTFSWRYPSPTTVGSIRLILCDTALIDDACGPVSGDFSTALLSSQFGGETGFSIFSQSANEILLSRPSAGAGIAQSTYVFDNIINPTGLPTRFFVRVSVYANGDGTGTPNHIGSVVNSTAEPINITTVVPPILFFCAGLTISEWCDNVNGNFIDYNDLSSVIEDAGVSQFGAATNATGGYVVTINGNTLTAGNRTISALSTPSANTPGVPQFGLNLRANTNPANGQDPFGAGIGIVAPDYGTPDLFKFSNGDIVASAASGTVFNTYTVTYIVNVSPDQPSGIYNTTIAYICTAAF